MSFERKLQRELIQLSVQHSDHISDTLTSLLSTGSAFLNALNFRRPSWPFVPCTALHLPTCRLTSALLPTFHHLGACGQLPLVGSTQLETVGDRAFAVAGPRLWNRLYTWWHCELSITSGFSSSSFIVTLLFNFPVYSSCSVFFFLFLHYPIFAESWKQFAISQGKIITVAWLLWFMLVLYTDNNLCFYSQPKPNRSHWIFASDTSSPRKSFQLSR